ncbi:putative chitinase [Panicum miliaceum]|uniref:chitinase n=1 Tax=Panicum miliaceum TaxID=4540 RepID=A0A3L6S2Y5_PANMI|nr:putative chitinase [Panicum miliaceum]
MILLHRNDGRCPARGFYTYYDAFVTAAGAFPGFGTTGDADTRKREVAARRMHETTAGGMGRPTGRYAWGYCFKEENGGATYCQESTQWPCVPGKRYYGRGPIQLSWNYNYGPAGATEAISVDLLSDPDLVARDAVVSLKTAIWFWMTPQAPKPSSHDVITGQWRALRRRRGRGAAAGRPFGSGSGTSSSPVQSFYHADA